MDPSIRKLLEVVYEAVIDAGINPENLKGTTTGVFVGAESGDALKYWTLIDGRENLMKYVTMGVPMYMQANQVSHQFDLKGPSMSLSTGCSASLYAMESAIKTIRSGACDRAIVAATKLNFNSSFSVDPATLAVFSTTGECKPFDKEANGFVLSEAIVSVVVEREDVAARSYAKIRSIRTSSEGMKKHGIFAPSGSSQETTFRNVYDEADIDFGSVFYVEAHGTGTQLGDQEELLGISNTFCKSVFRPLPMLVGSVKSNIGHTESAAGLSGIVKLVLAAQEGIIPPTLHFKEPQAVVSHTFDSSLQIASENVSIVGRGKFFGVSSFGVGGTNAHAVLEPHWTKQIAPLVPAGDKVDTFSSNKLNPILVPFSAQTQADLNTSLEEACENAKYPDFTALLYRVIRQNIPGHNFRGYGVIKSSDCYSTNTSDKYSFLTKSTVKINQNKLRPVGIYFSDTQFKWTGYVQDLLSNAAFQDSVERSKCILRSINVDIDQIAREFDTNATNGRHVLIKSAAVQIAVYDTIISLGIKPSIIFGEANGKIICAYADGCITAEEALLITDALGRAGDSACKLDSYCSA